MKNKDLHRPVIIKDQKILSEEEEKQILALANEADALFKELNKKLDIIINKYRNIIGFKNLKSSWDAHWKVNPCDWEYPVNWIAAAERKRLKWFLNDINIDRKKMIQIFNGH